MKTARCFLLCSVAWIVKADEPWSWVGHGSNYPEATRRPAESLDASAGAAVERLSQSAVPTAKEAEGLALRVLGGLDARDHWGTDGLYHFAAVQYPVEDAHPEALVWEVHIVRQGQGLTGVLWVDCDTRKVRILYR